MNATPGVHRGEQGEAGWKSKAAPGSHEGDVLLLEGLAQAHVRQALERDLPKAELPGVPRLHERAFSLVEELSSVSVDVVVADSPRLAGESKNLGTAGNRLVGVGLVKGDSPRFGPGRYWIVVIYGVPRE